MVRNYAASSARGSIGVTYAKLVPKLFFFVSGFSLNYYMLSPISFPECELFVLDNPSIV
jgi:hypothetical protein